MAITLVDGVVVLISGRGPLLYVSACSLSKSQLVLSVVRTQPCLKSTFAENGKSKCGSVQSMMPVTTKGPGAISVLYDL